MLNPFWDSRLQRRLQRRSSASEDLLDRRGAKKVQGAIELSGRILGQQETPLRLS